LRASAAAARQDSGRNVMDVFMAVPSPLRNLWKS
jgi:hypothetical protein